MEREIKSRPEFECRGNHRGEGSLVNGRNINKCKLDGWGKYIQTLKFTPKHFDRIGFQRE